MTHTSDRDELVRLAGEQALLSRDLRNLNADQQRDLLALRNLPTDMVLSADWHAKGIALLDRLRDRQQQMAMGHQRLAELAKLTGISTPCLCQSALSRLLLPFQPTLATCN